MKTQFSLSDIYDKNINFLIGAGASHGLFPTLALKIKDDADLNHTIETLATRFYETKESNSLYTLLFMHYYKTCIEPVMSMDFEILDLVSTDKE